MSPIHGINEQANAIICDQEEAIAALKNKLWDMENARDEAIGKSLELVQAMKRIECSNGPDSKKSMEAIICIARHAIDDFQGK